MESNLIRAQHPLTEYKVGVTPTRMDRGIYVAIGTCGCGKEIAAFGYDPSHACIEMGVLFGLHLVDCKTNEV